MSKKPPPDYKVIEKQLFLESKANVLNELNAKDKGIEQRIKTFCENFGEDPLKVEQKIRNDPMFAAHFAKKPKGMGFHEKVAGEWLNETLGLEVTTLPKSGKNALYVTSDGVITKINEGETPPSKSLDFMWEKNGIIFYAMHKYTEQSGGSQDNQFNEMKKTLQNFQRASNPTKRLIIIVDGPYYNDRRMRELENLTRTTPPQSYAVHIEDVPAIVGKY